MMCSHSRHTPSLIQEGKTNMSATKKSVLFPDLFVAVPHPTSPQNIKMKIKKHTHNTQKVTLN